MFQTTLLSVLFIFLPLHQPAGSVTDGPSSIRSFRPASTESDDALESYFLEAGPLAIEFYDHLTLLSNPWLGGRQPGTNGSHLASDYIIWNMKQSNIEPAFDAGNSWFQEFDFDAGNSAPTLLDAFVAVQDMALVDDRDYVVLGNSGSGETNAPITFVGYAIESGDNGYSSFDADTDLTGQIALMLRYEPLDEDGASQWAGRRFSPQANIRNKMQAVISRGATGVILVNPPNCRDGRRGLETSRSSRFGSTDVPVVQFSETAANLTLDDETIADLQKLADVGEVTTMQLNTTAMLRTELESSGIHARNIGGILNGKGDLAEEWVVIGGHYDHLGHGYLGTQSQGELHQGADDNASGSSAILVLVRMLSSYYSETDDASLRSVLFIFFDAEEAGLHGSAAFVDNPIMDLANVNAMINLDMVGNLSDHNISLSGTGTAKEFETIIPEIVAQSPLAASLTTGGTGPSDHTNFYRNDIPVLFFFTGITDEYHTPKDKAFTTNPAGAALVIELAHAFARSLVNDPALTFAENTAGGSGRTSSPPAPVRFGIHPSYTSTLESGILISGVSEGTSAEEAGLLEGDILLAWNDEELTGGRKLMELLRSSKPDDVVIFTVQRNGKNIQVEVVLRAP